jgi:ribbon-helix-helix protein, copG family
MHFLHYNVRTLKREVNVQKEVNLNIRMSSELKRVLTQVAQQQDLTVSLIVRKLIERYIDENAQIDIFKQKGAKK